MSESVEPTGEKAISDPSTATPDSQDDVSTVNDSSASTVLTRENSEETDHVAVVLAKLEITSPSQTEQDCASSVDLPPSAGWPSVFGGGGSPRLEIAAAETKITSENPAADQVNNYLNSSPEIYTRPGQTQLVSNNGASLPEEVLLYMQQLAARYGFVADFAQAPLPKRNTLTGIPFDARKIIMTFLLVNEELGRVTSVEHYKNGYGAGTPYDLHPAILRVNKLCYGDGMKELYGQLFYFGCIAGYDRICPITRYLNSVSRKIPVRYIPAIMHVRRWLVVHGSNSLLGAPTWHFKDFCRAISLSNPRTVEVAVIPRGAEHISAYGGTYMDPEQILSPLQMLRNMTGEKSIKIRDATVSEIPERFGIEDTADLRLLDTDIAHRVEIEVRAPGEPQIERMAEMQYCLLKYAQTFETSQSFKNEMAAVSIEEMRSYWGMNPYREPRPHPVEDELANITVAVSFDNMEKFKLHRAFIINYLEAQYQRASFAFSTLEEFIKKEKRPGRLFGAANNNTVHCSESDLYEAMRLILTYADSMVRDAPPEIKIQIVKVQTRFDLEYSSLHRHALISHLKMTFEHDIYVTFTPLYRDLVDNLDAQFFAMRKARRELFRFDLGGDHGCDIDTEASASVEKKDWALNTSDDEAEAFLDNMDISED